MSRRTKKKADDSAIEVIEDESIIKAVEFPDLSFSNKADLFKALKENEKEIIAEKTSIIKNSEGCSFSLTSNKSFATKEIKGLEEGKIAAIINTTNYIDSHNDVHLPKIWNKSVKDQKGNIYYVVDHDLKVNSVIAYPKDVDMSVQTLTWKELGQDFAGNTDALIFVVTIDEIKNGGAIDVIENKIPIEHSVRMQYVKLFLAINSDAKEDKVYKKNFDKYINDIANKEVAIERGYFWGIMEAKISKEGSMVLFGSNDATPLIHSDGEPSKVSQESESSKDTQNLEEKEDTQTKRRRR